MRYLLMLLLVATLAPDPGAATTLEPYGFVRLDAIFDDSRLSHPQFPFWVESEASVKDDAELDIHARLTRVGFNLAPEQVGERTTVSGKVEIDFQNGGKESRAVIRMRHAYLQIETGGVEVLAGQTWDLVSPLYPAANNDGMMWNAGNTGDRRPQFRLTVRPEVAGGSARLSLAAGMPNAVNDQDLDGNGQLDGLDAGIPVVQALAELDLPDIRIGAWGHFSRDEVGPFAGLATQESFSSTLFGGHVRIPLGDDLWIQGEGFYGKNATDVRAGIGQGVNLATRDEIHTAGGWGEIGLKASAKYTVVVGATLDDPDDKDLPAGARERNFAVYVVQHFRPVDRVRVGIEYLYWTTDYLGGPSAEANRVDSHLTLTF